MSFLSVVVSTYNREKTLRGTLDRLVNQTLPRDRYEIVVVDDGSPDGTEGMVAEYMKTCPVSMRYYRHSNRGPGATENVGIRQAKGPWVLLMADDIQPLPGMVEAHYRMHEAHPEPNVAVGGKVIESPDLPKTVFHRHWDLFNYKIFEGLTELPPTNFWGCNVSAKRDYLLEKGMFIEHPLPAHEDTELGWRLSKTAGLRILYCPAALSHHLHPLDIDKACEQFYGRGTAFDGLSDHITDPEFYVRIRLLTRKTWPLFMEVWRRQRRGELRELGSVPKIILNYWTRELFMNRIAVPYILVPLIRAAEKHPSCERFVSQRTLRFAVTYYFLQGLKELRRRRKREGQPLTV